MTMAMSHSSRLADAGLDMAMVTVTGPEHELPAEVTPLMWPWPRASGWRGAGADDPGSEGVPGDRVALVGPGASGPVGDATGVLGVRLAGGEVRVAGAGAGVDGPPPGMPNAFSQLSRATYAAVPSAPRATTTAAMAEYLLKVVQPAEPSAVMAVVLVFRLFGFLRII
jgi:hypothetical protein